MIDWDIDLPSILAFKKYLNFLAAQPLQLLILERKLKSIVVVFLWSI